MLDFIKTQLQASCLVKQRLIENEPSLQIIQSVAICCIDALKSNNKIILAGNGGSAGDAQHIAAELVGRFEKDRGALPAMTLTTNTSSMTAIANDYGYNAVFSRQIQAFGQAGDVFLGISTSGNSSNIIAAIESCRDADMIVVGMTGETGGKMLELCDYCIRVPDKNTARIQESHITIGHIICSLIENELFDSA